MITYNHRQPDVQQTLLRDGDRDSTVRLRYATRPPAFTTQPLLRYSATLGAGALIVILATRFEFLQRWLLTASLNKSQRAAVLGLAIVMPLVVEGDKLIQRRSHRVQSG
jgi:hypothetical protein